MIKSHDQRRFFLEKKGACHVGAGELVKILQSKRMFVATAESCTGGGIAAAITDVPGSSEVFAYGIVSYSNEAKEKLLQVPHILLEEHGAVSREVAQAMAEGARGLSGADIAIAVTGIAGPSGGSAQKPVGLVYIAVAGDKGTRTNRYLFPGARREVRQATKEAAISQALQYLQEA